MMVRTVATSATVLPIGPGVSCEWLIGTTCVRDTRPMVGLMRTRPLAAEGHTIEPSVSVPTAMAARLAATAAPEPDDEPQALRSSAYGLRVSPPTALQPLVDSDER